MSGWTKEYESWLKVIEEHYGSLDKFSDAPSVRILLEGAKRERKELSQLLNAIQSLKHDPVYAEFDAELTKVMIYQGHLEAWLNARGLES